ncbi:FxsA family protein [Desulfuribacillus alkaliarsenatis]|uniref:Membrane protein FxsA n=1 Tax=Desulfuribacillus alkaliarsenatis TaxID=766136 RepID=A0A1E5FYD6_9FIRM|nr:FxsA family protein [Desulfuribacillus alkaliarsenatis]OEF95583.1 membrane protein FxsA [Desulfuribacillus alkaliarsenatis]
MFKILALLFIVVPAIEIYLIIKVGQIFGALTTLGIVVLTGFLGAYLAKSQGRQTLMLAQIDLQQGRVPSDLILDGLAILVGGVVLLTPGFVTDIFGFFLLVPTTRGMFKLAMRNWITKMINNGNVHIYTSRRW